MKQNILNSKGKILMENNEKQKYLIPSTIWESVLGHNTGCLMVDSIVNGNVECHQIYDRGTPDERIGMKLTTFKIDEFLVAFKPEENNPENDKIVDNYERNLGVEYSTLSHQIGVRFNSNGDIVSTSLLSNNESTESSNYIKMDGEKSGFDGGAIRYTKNGKGRFDLVPGDVIADILSYATDRFYGNAVLTASKSSMLEEAYRGDLDDRFANTVINMVIHHYCAADIVGDVGEEPMMEVSEFCFFKGFYDMLKDLALHYECGAEKYGVNNWKKGIPVTGGERGGSFMDSALRHLNQYCQDLTDEKHYISCIWNCVCGLWTLRNQNK